MTVLALARFKAALDPDSFGIQWRFPLFRSGFVIDHEREGWL